MAVWFYHYYSVYGIRSLSSPYWPKHRITNPNRLFHSIHHFYVGVLQHIMNIPKTLATCLLISVPHGFMAGCCSFWQKQSLPHLCTPRVSLALAAFSLFSSLNSFSRGSDTPALRQRQKHASDDEKQGKKDCAFWEQLHLLTNILSDQTLSSFTLPKCLGSILWNQ